MATDIQLIEQIQNGEREAYGQLFHKYYQQVYSICFSILKNHHDAEEVTNDTFFHAYMKLDQLKKPDKFFPWLKKITQNRSKNYLRDKPEEVISLPLANAPTVDDGIEVIASTQDSTLIQRAPDEHLLSQELADAIMEAVEALPMQYREVVRARIDGLDHSEIGERLNISAQASMNRLHRARKQLLAHLKDFLNAIFGLPKILFRLPCTQQRYLLVEHYRAQGKQLFKNIISGGILAMKIGTTTKVTLCVISVLVAGFVGFQIVTHKPDVKSPKVVTQRQITKSEAKQRPVSKMGSRPSKSKLSESEIEGTVEGLDSKEGVTPAEKVTEEGKMEEQETLQEEVPQKATMSEADLIDEFNQIKARIMAGEKFNDCSTPTRALLTRISVWHHWDEEAFQAVEARPDGKRLSDFSEQHREGFTKQLESVRVLEVPIPKPNPSNGDVHPIFTIEREGEPNTPEGELGVYALFYYDGLWRGLYNGYDQDNWRPEIADEWLREKLEFLQSQ